MKINTIFTVIIAIFFMASSCKSDAKQSETTLIEDVVANNESAIQPTNEVIEESTKGTESNNADDKLEVESQKEVRPVTNAETKTPKKPKQEKEKVVSEPINPPIKPTNKSTTKPEKPILKDEIILDNNPVNPKNDKVEKPENPSNETKPEKPVLYDVPIGSPNHKLFDGFLGTYVSDSGEVDYSGMKKKEVDLDAYLTSLMKTKITTTWSRNEKLAFWLNAYNAYTLKLILDNYPVMKITDLHGGKPWDYKWIKLDGQTLSLNNIENDIIRPVFKEPRIHFAVNCAAKSCPPLLNSAFTSGGLEKQLQSQTKKFINNAQYNTLGKSEITISKIFDWYSADFGNVASFVAKYASSTVKPTAKIKFNEYNWALNGN